MRWLAVVFLLSIFLFAQSLTKSQSITQSEDTPFNVGPVKVVQGDTVYISVHCNSPSHPCLSQPPTTLDGKVFELNQRIQSATEATQENSYSLKLPPGDVSISIVPDRSHHKIHQGWDYNVLLEAKP